MDRDSSAANIGPEQLTTKIYYYCDDQPMPYSTEVPVPPSRITLADFKQFINRRNYKFYYKVYDPLLKSDVKTDILNEDGLFEDLWISRISMITEFQRCSSQMMKDAMSCFSSPIQPEAERLQLQHCL